MADNKNKPRRTPQSNKNNAPGGPRRWLSILFYTLAFVLLGYYMFGDKDGSKASKEISYTKLCSYIEVGAIDRIDLTDDLIAKANVKPQSYTLVFGTQGDGEQARGTLKAQVPSMEEFSKYIDSVNATRKAEGDEGCVSRHGCQRADDMGHGVHLRQRVYGYEGVGVRRIGHIAYG